MGIVHVMKRPDADHRGYEGYNLGQRKCSRCDTIQRCRKNSITGVIECENCVTLRAPLSAAPMVRRGGKNVGKVYAKK